VVKLPRRNLDSLAIELQKLSIQERVEDIINLLISITQKEGPLHPNNEKELNLWNIPGWYFFLRQGKYKLAEKIYRAFYKRLLDLQENLGRIHKGMPLQNLALSLFFQGKTDDAIKFFLCAYIEDVIRGKGADSVEQGAASKVLRGFCGVFQDELFIVRKRILLIIRDEIPLNPEEICNSAEILPLLRKIQERYTKYIPNTWKWEVEGQRALTSGDFEKSFRIYIHWFEAFLRYQNAVNNRVHKGHPLFNAGKAKLSEGKDNQAYSFFLAAYVEDVVSALKLGDADATAAFKSLSSVPKAIEFLKEIELFIFSMKEKRENIDNPFNILKKLQNLKDKTLKEFKEEEKQILLDQQKDEEEFCKNISEKKPVGKKSDNIFYVMKRWNSATPRCPSNEDDDTRGGGYFLVWNGKGVVIDPGYDFLKTFHEEGFRIRNIDLIIVTHAHDDHTQDLEAICSVLNKLNSQCKKKHSIDLIISEGVRIKYSALFHAMKDLLHERVLKPDDSLKPSEVFKKKYDFEIEAVKTHHNEKPWMVNNTGFGVILNLKKDTSEKFKIGITGDTSYWEGIEKRYSGLNLLIEHIGTFKGSENHLCYVGCLNLLERLPQKPNLVVVSEFGKELIKHRVNICSRIESSVNHAFFGGIKMPVFAGDIGMKIKIPSKQIFCHDTKRFEDFSKVMDKDIEQTIRYVTTE
jgi:hypothetical protein